MSNKQFHPALAKASGLGGLRFTNIADISCDIEVRSAGYDSFILAHSLLRVASSSWRRQQRSPRPSTISCLMVSPPFE